MGVEGARHAGCGGGEWDSPGHYSEESVRVSAALVAYLVRGLLRGPAF